MQAFLGKLRDSIRKQYAFFLLLCLFGSVFSGSAVGAEPDDVSSFASSYLIADVPYVSQQTDFYCIYAAPAMVLQYFDVNASLYDVLFHSGVGYSVMYSPSNLPRFFVGCIGTACWEKDRSFLGGLYGLSYVEDQFKKETSDEQRWRQYWSSVKENLTQDRPVMTMIDPVVLPSVQQGIRKQLNISEQLWNQIPLWLFDFFPVTMSHMVVLTGFNETNNSVCFHDPAAALFGCPEEGYYAWMNLSIYRQIMTRFSYRTDRAFLCSVYQDTPEPPLPVSERYEKAQRRNIEKIKGNVSSYDEYIYQRWQTTQLGINGLRGMQMHLSGGRDNRVKTILIYKWLGLRYQFAFSYLVYRFCDRFAPDIVDLDDYHSIMNYCHQISLEKAHVASYLEQLEPQLSPEHLQDLCHQNAELLRLESESWTRYAQNFSLFLKRGMKMSIPRGIQITRLLQEDLTDIIEREEQIISTLETD